MTPVPFDIRPKIAAWRQLLLDTSRRNRLVNFRSGRVGGIDLVHPAPGDAWQRLVGDGGRFVFPWKRELLGLPPELLDSDRLAEDPATDGPAEPPLEDEFTTLCLKAGKLGPDHLLTDFTDKHLTARLGRLALAAREAQAEQGVNVLYLAFGFLRWYESEASDEPARSPLLLVPVRLDREGVEAPWKLAPEDDEIRRNDTLAELLRTQFRVTLPQPGEAQPDPEDEAGWLTGYLPLVRERVAAFRRWAVEDAVALGVFNFQKLAMWEDLGRNTDRIAAHPLCRAIAGDAGVDLRPPPDLPAVEELDERVPPEQVNQILDADSSQQAAIEAVKRGAHLVLDGPPGTGKSQTIANIIAELLAAGKTVLFVSEKAAALDVVRRRLDACRLGDFCLELHSARTNRKTVLAELGRCLTLTPEQFRNPTEQLKRLADTRRDLNDYARELHRPRPPLGLTAFQAHGELARLDQLTGQSRVVIPDVREMTAADLDRLMGVLAQLADCTAVLGDPEHHPWRGCKVMAWSIGLRDDARFHLGRVAGLIPKLTQAASPLVNLGFADEALTVPGLRAATTETKAALAVPSCPPAWFIADARATAETVVALDAAVRRYRELLPTVPELAPEAVRAADPAVLDAAAAVPIDKPPLISPPASVRELAVRLREAGARLAAVYEAAITAHTAGRVAAHAAGVTVPLPPSQDLATFADQLEALATLGHLPASWCDPVRRKELLAVIGRAAEESRTATTIRTELVARMSPTAFAAESVTLAKRAAGYRSAVWRVLLVFGWRSVRAKVAEWYPRGLPPTAELLADLRKLSDYHTLTTSLRQVAAAYPADFVATDGAPDWSQSLTRIRDADAALAPFSPVALKDFTPPDRAKLAGPLADLRAAARTLHAAVGAMAAGYASPEVLNYPPDQLAAWAADHAKTVEAARGACDTAVSLLAPGRDLEPVAVPARLKTVAELARLARQAERGVAEGLTSSVETALAKDWGPESKLAGPLLAFLDTRPGPVPTGLARALSDSDTRTQLAAAIRQFDALAAEGFDASWGFVTGTLFDPDAEVSTGVMLHALPVTDLAEWCQARVADADRLLEWVRFADAERDIRAAEIGTVLDEVRRGEVPIAEAPAAFRARFLRLWLDAVYADAPILRDFTAGDRDRLVNRFRALDRRSLALTPERIRHARLSAPYRTGLADGDAPASSEVGILLKEVHKKTRHLPLRRLFAQIPTLLPRLKPCLMMSPLAVSTYLQDPAVSFDLVIFDEASQVRPHDAIGAVYRGKQLVVSGDQKQLPPTSFFDRSLDPDSRPEEADESLADFESVLDVCCTLGLARRQLRWHYRSRREGLIAFSNRFFYENQLVTFPGANDADATPAVSFRHVPEGRFKDGENPPEARAVAAFVLDHFCDHPDQTLGVIAFSQRQQLRILDEIESLRRRRPEVEEFFRDDRDDPFFVKNLENVQGDERDVIVLSVGYGPDASGKIAMRFGPLNRQGGERRLNVAVTRARERAVVISSMTAADIDRTRAGGEGPRLLKAYLDYAQNGPVALERVADPGDGDAESPFEAAVAAELERQGLQLHRQVGCGGYRIDLAVLDPDRPGRYRLGIECDGATYHSSATARDRDRLRQQVLEGLGWRICRVWSTDWVRDRAGQVRGVLDALKRTDAPAPPPAPEPAAEPETPTVLSEKRSPQPPAPEPAPRSIEETTDAEIEQHLLETVTRFGGTGTEDLVRRVSRLLGFQRLGPNIKERIAGVLTRLLSAGRVRVSDPEGRVRMV